MSKIMSNHLVEPLHQWIFKKNCSFTPRQVGLFYIAQATFSLFVASFFLFQGVWIVLPFTFLELIVLAFALLMYARHATDFEVITLKKGQLEIETSVAGINQLMVFNSSWVQLSSQLTDKKMIRIGYQGKTFDIGKFLHASLREDFLRELQRYLRLST
jgi:uncharacterized membrane protein